MKQDRVEFRTTHQERKQFEAAANLLSMNLSTFLRRTAVEKASEVLRQNTAVVLSDEDRDAFLEALSNPTKPNKELKKALQAYRRSVTCE